ncbi:hypothetical protein J32TS2_05920 [Shouchella clausii]|uniref:hypothetical protein n=1 Tax=Shouchella clausii TaxID=79880 RepID=UPI001B10BA28|nr:hypothetical protein [Shouchella clausii]GIN15236.1 hypothetical protein J32TS2_05920 [Shouchella clausii]
MKRYWYSMTLVVFSMVVFSWLAISSTLKQQDIKEIADGIELKTISGSEDVIDGFGIRGQNERYYAVPLYGKLNKPSFLESLDAHPNPAINELQKQFRSFFRGKDTWNSLYVDQDFIVHIDVPSQFHPIEKPQSLQISWLDRSEGQSLDFRIETTPSKQVDLVDIQIRDSLLHIALLESVGNSEVVSLYKIDPGSKQIEERQELAHFSGSEEYVSTISKADIYLDSYPFSFFSPNSYLTWAVEHVSPEGDTEIEQVYSYSYDSEELDVLSEDNNNSEEVQQALAMENMGKYEHFQVGNELILLQQDGSYLSYHLIDLEKHDGPLPEATTFEIDGEIATVACKDGVLYVFTVDQSHQDTLAYVKAIHLSSNEVVYEGQFVNTSDSFISFNWLDVYYERPL